MDIGEKIRQLRRKQNLTQEELAAMVKVHSNTIRKWEKGISYPGAEELRLIANALGTTTTYFYYDDEPETFIKKSAYQDKTEIQNSIPSMAYWGSLVDNAEKTAENGKNITVIIDLVRTALSILETAIKKGKQESYTTGSSHVIPQTSCNEVSIVATTHLS